MKDHQKHEVKKENHHEEHKNEHHHSVKGLTALKAKIATSAHIKKHHKEK